MAAKKSYVCSVCQYKSGFLIKICPNCNSRDSYELKTETTKSEPKNITVAAPAGAKSSSVKHISKIDSMEHKRYTTSIGELDRVLGGGLVPGSIILIGGAPGTGKSTLTLSVSSVLSKTAGTVLYVSGEESEAQVKLRAERLNINPGELYLVFENELEQILEKHIPETNADIIIVDSITTIASRNISSQIGAPNQIKYCAKMLQHLAKSTGKTIILIGHVTKSGEIAGPNTLNHDVDAVLYLEGDQFHQFRLLRAEKNRFGSVGEVGVFEMTGQGLVEVPNPSEAFLAERATNKSGSSVAITVEGSRPLVVEVQALCTTNNTMSNPARRSNGINRERLHMIAAVLNKYVPFIDLSDKDIFMSVVGGMRVEEPSADLSVALSLVSSWHNTPTPANVVGIGEIGLTGELRSVPQIELRLREALQLGFTKVVMSEIRREINIPRGIEIIQVKDIEGALKIVFDGLIDFDAEDKPAKTIRRGLDEELASLYDDEEYGEDENDEEYEEEYEEE